MHMSSTNGYRSTAAERRQHLATLAARRDAEDRAIAELTLEEYLELVGRGSLPGWGDGERVDVLLPPRDEDEIGWYVARHAELVAEHAGR